MTVLVITIGAFLLFFLLMSLGVLFGREPVKGSCGGLGKLDGLGECEICGGDSSRCDAGAGSVSNRLMARED